MRFDVHVFISHSWTYSQHYETLEGWIFRESWNVNGAPIKFHDQSVPKDSPIHNAPNAETLRRAIFDRINNSHVVVIPTGMYASHSTWIRKEIVGAKHHLRPILAVDPWGQKRSASVVMDAAAKSVGWTKNGVVNGIWELY